MRSKGGPAPADDDAVSGHYSAIYNRVGRGIGESGQAYIGGAGFREQYSPLHDPFGESNRPCHSHEGGSSGVGDGRRADGRGGLLEGFAVEGDEWDHYGHQPGDTEGGIPHHIRDGR